jgi:hypothetical protein
MSVDSDVFAAELAELPDGLATEQDPHSGELVPLADDAPRGPGLDLLIEHFGDRLAVVYQSGGGTVDWSPSGATLVPQTNRLMSSNVPPDAVRTLTTAIEEHGLAVGAAAVADIYEQQDVRAQRVSWRFVLVVE